MTKEEFRQEMQRLITQYQSGVYSQPRLELIWREVQALDANTMRKIVDNLLGESRVAPLVPEFREAVAKSREQVWNKQKGQNERDAKAFFASSFHDDDVKTVIGMMVGRILGQVSDESYSSFQEMLKNVAETSPYELGSKLCGICHGEGIVMGKDSVQNLVAYRCRCLAGEKKPSVYPIFESFSQNRENGV